MERHNAYTSSVILQDFRAFFKMLLLLKARAFQGAHLPEADNKSITPKGTDSAETKIKETEDGHEDSAKVDTAPSKRSVNQDESIHKQTLAQQIREKLESILTTQYKDLGSNKGGYAARYYEEAQYIMVALADETFINLNWQGKEEWEDNLLESLMYNTQDAGDKFFDSLDTFLSKSHSNQTADMAALYLIALGLGFKGRFKDPQFEPTIAKYKEKLYRYITSEDPSLLHNQSHLFPNTYNNIIGDRQNTNMPNIRAWWISLSVIGGAYVFFSTLIWLHHMHTFSPLVDALQKWAEV